MIDFDNPIHVGSPETTCRPCLLGSYVSGGRCPSRKCSRVLSFSPVFASEFAAELLPTCVVAMGWSEFSLRCSSVTWNTFVLLDRVRPKSFDLVLEAAQAVAPWTEAKIQYVTSPLSQTCAHVEPGTALLGVHACGARTDQCIDHAISLNSTVALLPCCRRHRLHPSPECLKNVLGADIAIDVDRTYRLHAAGYHVRWDYISPRITEMNRVLIGRPNQ